MTDRDEDTLLAGLLAEQLAHERDHQRGVVSYQQLTDGGRLASPDDVVVHQIVGLAGKIRGGTSPPRLAYEHNLVPALLDGRTAVRLRWRQVMAESCATATALGTILQRHGWTGQIRTCAECHGHQVTAPLPEPGGP